MKHCLSNGAGIVSHTHPPSRVSEILCQSLFFHIVGDDNLSHCAWLALSWSIVFAYVFSLIVTLRVHVFEPIPLASGQKRKTKTCMVIRFVVSCFMFQDGHLAWRRTSDVRDSTLVYNVCVCIYIYLCILILIYTHIFLNHIYIYYIYIYISTYKYLHIQVNVYIRESYLYK